MKKIFLFLFIFVSIHYAQQLTNISTVELSSGGSYIDIQAAIAASTTYKEVLIYAVDSNATSTAIPGWFNTLTSDLTSFFTKATFEKLDYSITLLKKNGEAFRFAYGDTVTFSGSCDHVHSYRNVESVIDSADIVVDFKDYDYDNDDKVYIHFLSGGPKSGGVVGCLRSFLTNDYGTNGYIRVYIKAESRGSSFNVLRSVIAHESGHDLFKFPDMDHSGLDTRGHYSLGGFDVMAGGGFEGVPSLYNPFFRDREDWFTPVQITASDTDVEMKDFQKNSLCYVYEPSSLSSDAILNQKFYVSYHKALDENDNKFYHTWPFDDTKKDGVMIWHAQGIYNSTSNYSDWRTVPIDIEAAHGKYEWTTHTDSVHNTYVENSLTGRDSLEIRKIVTISNDDTEIQGPYYGKDHGSNSVFYTPDVSQDFTPFTNPNSNFTNKNSSENYAQNIVSGFSVKNLRTSNNKVYVDFAINDFTVSENTTLAKGKWRFENNITVATGVTLTIQEGTNLTFQNSSALKVFGTLNVNGTSSDKVTFDFVSPSSYNGIKFYSGSSGAVENAVINDAYYGVYVSSVSPTIENCEISDCTYGIYTSFASPDIETNEIHDVYRGIFTYQGSPTITDNYIYDASDYGILVNASDTYIRENTIKNCKGGIWAYGNQTIKLHGYGKNEIVGYESGGHAVYVTGGTAHLGEYSSRGYNSFIRNTLNTVVYNSSTNEVLAEKNYWGGSPSSSWFYGDVEWSFPLSSESGGVGSTLDLSKAVAPDLTPDRILFCEAIALSDSNKHKEASKKFKELIKDYPDSRFAGLSVAWAMSSDKKEKEFKNQTSYLKSLKNHTNKKVRDNHFLWLASLEARNGDIEASKLVANSTPIDEPVGVEIRLNLANDMLNLYNDEQGAEVIFNELLAAGATESTRQTINVIKETAQCLGEINIGEESIKKEAGETIEVSESTLSNAYPNPFNPTTTISYQIPNDGFVNLVVYNTLGQVVAELVNEHKTSGNYSVQFNASSLSSGVYFYKIEIGSFTKVNKMLLMK